MGAVREKSAYCPVGNPLVPIGVQHAGAGDVGVPQHPILQVGEIHPFGGDAEVIGQRRGHQGRFLLRGGGGGRLTSGPRVPQAFHRPEGGGGGGDALRRVFHRHRRRAHHRHLVVGDALDDVVPHQGAALAAAGAVPLVADIEPAVYPVLLGHAPPAQGVFVAEARPVFPEQAVREIMRIHGVHPSFPVCSSGGGISPPS